MSDTPTRCGYVVIAGRPNVGKSTLLNQFLGVHLAAATHKPQTTRNRILGILTEEHSQFVFLDTPGIHQGGKRLLNRALNRTAIATLPEGNVVMFVVEAGRWTAEDDMVLEHLRQLTAPVVLVVNKVDRLVDKSVLMPFLQGLQEKMQFVEIMPVSAYRKRDIRYLLKHLQQYLPEAEFAFDEDQITDRSMRFIAAELIREQLTAELSQELPYALAVEIEQYKETPERVEIDAVIYVERDNQKAIVIGAGGERLKSVGTKARKRIMTILDQRVHLQLWVKVKSGWQDNSRLLTQFGIEE